MVMIVVFVSVFRALSLSLALFLLYQWAMKSS